MKGVEQKWLKHYLTMKKSAQNGVVNQMSGIKFQVPMGSVLGATLFLVYVNYLCNATFKGRVILCRR